jgi:hypothetical protein
MRTSFRAMLDAFNHIPAEFIEECAPNYKTEEAVHRSFADHLDDCYGSLMVAGVEVWASQALRRCDPIAYDQEFYNYTSEELEMWIDTPDGWLTNGDVDNIVDAWEMLTDEQQNEYLSPADRDELCPEDD